VTDRRPDALAEVVERFLLALKEQFDSQELDALAEMDLTLTQARVLFTIAVGGETLPINVVAERLNLSTATAGRCVERLVTLGLVDRREDPTDRRSKLVSLTAAGEDLAETKHEQGRAQIRTFSASLPCHVADRLQEAMTAAIDAARGAPSTDQANDRTTGQANGQTTTQANGRMTDQTTGTTHGGSHS
jgi:DNA-binding MarR family transcriptional regulator